MKNKVIGILDLFGFNWVSPFIRIISGEEPKEQMRQIGHTLGIPVAAFAVFLMLWSVTASRIETSLGKVPGPTAVLAQAKVLVDEHFSERAKGAEFYKKQAELNAQKIAEDPAAVVKTRRFTGKPTYFDQIATSLLTVFLGFGIASLAALPLGVICGMNRTAMTALNPFIQIFKPISPLAWLPLVSILVSALYTKPSDMFPKAFVISAITVSLCSLWPTLINTALGVASIDKDLLNVSRVLQLKNFTKVFKVIIPASLPYIFTGLRISLGVGWMVLIASEMLAQNPGLGKFVWDEFQNGSSESLARILVAVFTIGIIGFILDRVMVVFQSAVSFNKDSISA
jgi:nitrate/nitrite transport system permease protein